MRMRVLRENLRVEIENEMRVFLESLNFEIEMRVSQKSVVWNGNFAQGRVLKVFGSTSSQIRSNRDSKDNYYQ